MKKVTVGMLGAVLVLTGLTTIGCDDKDKKELISLRQQYNELSNQHKELQAKYNDATAREADLAAKCDTKDAEIRDLQMRLKTAQAAKPGPGTTPPAKVESKTAEGWTATPHGDKITVGSDILFSPGSAALTAEGKRALAKIAKDIGSHYAKLPVRVFGHTDTDPIKKSKDKWDDNLELSANRAMVVTRYLATQGVDVHRIETVAMGEWHPEAAGSSKDAKKKNRRVEIVVVK